MSTDAMNHGNSAGPAQEQTLISLGIQQTGVRGLLRLAVVVEDEVVVECEPHIGLEHRGLERLAEQSSWQELCGLLGRLDPWASSSGQLAYAHAVESLADIDVPRRAQCLRLLALELERASSHLGALANIFGLLAIDRRKLLQLRDRLESVLRSHVGERLVAGHVCIGGVRRDCGNDRLTTTASFCRAARGELQRRERSWLRDPLRLARLDGLGVLHGALARQHAVTGPALRASGDPKDLRRDHPTGAYEWLESDLWKGAQAPAPFAGLGDARARLHQLAAEAALSLSLVATVCGLVPAGEHVAAEPTSLGLPPPKGECYARVEGPRGELGARVFSTGGATPDRVRLRSPSLALISAVASVVRAAPIQLIDLPLVLASLDPSMAEADR